MKSLYILLLLLIYSELTYSINFELSVHNQTITGNYVTFDLYIRTTAASDTLFIASSSWGWTYNIANFTNTTFTVVEGYSTNLKSRTGVEVGELYYALTANQPNGDKLTGDISGPDPQTLTTFNQRVARISNQTLYHRIGRYKITGITNFNGTLNLNWFIPYCAIWQYETAPPFNTEQVTGTYMSIPNLTLPVNITQGEIPKEYRLIQNHPNPFNPVTKITFDIPASSDVTVKVYNIIGEEVAVLISEKLNAGTYQTDFNGDKLPSGIYLYSITAKGEVKTFTESKKMVLLK